jgi:hypothetical protein
MPLEAHHRFQMPVVLLIVASDRPVLRNSGALLVDDFLPMNEVQGDEDAASSIYGVKFSRRGATGFQNSGIQVERVGELWNRDATRIRIQEHSGLPRLESTSASQCLAVESPNKQSIPQVGNHRPLLVLQGDILYTDRMEFRSKF